jgi:intracellular sulfur oxidation DsrE/DsrF family protein
MKQSTDRRSFLSLTAASLAASVAVPSVLPAQPPVLEPWLAGLDGKHKQFFDAGNLADARPLKRVGNFLMAYHTAYGLDGPQISTLFGAHGDGLGFVLGDSLWREFKLGELYGVKTKSGAFAVANPYLTGEMLNGLSPDDSVSGLMKRGVRFLGCMNSVAALAKRLADAGHGPEAGLRQTIVEGFIPGAMSVPAMLLAGNRAQESGFTYAFLA